MALSPATASRRLRKKSDMRHRNLPSYVVFSISSMVRKNFSIVSCFVFRACLSSDVSLVIAAILLLTDFSNSRIRVSIFSTSKLSTFMLSENRNKQNYSISTPSSMYQRSNRRASSTMGKRTHCPPFEIRNKTNMRRVDSHAFDPSTDLFDIL